MSTSMTVAYAFAWIIAVCGGCIILGAILERKRKP